MNLDEGNSRLTGGLKGKRLICEATFSCEEVDAWRNVLVPQGIKVWDSHSSLAAVTTVGTGMYHYEHGDFWSSFSGLDTPVEQKEWGQRFKRFLEEHESLETFQNLPGLAYVAPILAHGGIPQYCLPVFFGLLTHYGDPEQPSSDFIDFIREHPASMTNIDKPVQRFLLHGGEVAEEFVARTLALWQSRESGDGGGTHGLPGRVVEAFSQWYANREPTQCQRIRRLPKPEIRMSPGDLWVYLYLPRCDNHPEIAPNACWESGGKSWAVSRDHTIPLLLSDCWTVACEGREVSLQGISNSVPALFFDSSTGKMIPNPRLRRLPECLWVVFSQSFSVEPKPVYREEIPCWPGYVIAVFNLEGYKSLNICGHWFEVRRPFFHVEHDPVVSGVTTEDGTPIFHAVPKIKWEGTANLSLSRGGKNEGNIDIKSGQLQLWFDEPGEYEFILRGPFGQNVRKRFVLIPDFQINMQPKVMWPNTPRVSCSVSADVDIHTSDGRPPPFVDTDPCFRFQADLGKTQTNLIARGFQLQWRALMSSKEASEWETEPITISVQDLEQASYPRFVCEMGQLANEIDVALIGKHGAIHPPQGYRSAVARQNAWEFDLRMALDQVRQSGLAEEFEISVRATDGGQLYRGAVMSVHAKWDLQDFRAKWMNQEQVIQVTWREGGNVVSGRWLVLIPLWRPWEGAIQVHKLDEPERVQFTWILSDIRPGRYAVRAVHAPWGCEKWLKAQHIAQQFIDVAKSSWKGIFDNQEAPESVEEYAESLLAHWYRPELVQQPPRAPTGLSKGSIQRFLNCMKQTDHLEAVRIPRDGSGSLNIFLQNPKATTDALENKQNWPRIWERVLPSKNIIGLTELSHEEKIFIRELVEHWIDGFDGMHFQQAAKDTIRQVAHHMQEQHLSEPIRKWLLNVKILRRDPNRRLLPNPDDVIFICEYFSLVEHAGDSFLIRQYERLKAAYQCREAV